MPIARYFVIVGGALAVLLLIAGWSLPEYPESFPDRPEVIDRATIRIRSARKWPEKVVLDTNQPTIVPPFIEMAPAEQLVARQPDEVMDQTPVDSPAKPSSDLRPIDAHHPPARARGRAARAFSPIHVARVRKRNEPPRLGTGEECCRFERVDGPVTSRVVWRKRVARRELWIGWHWPEAN